VNPPTPAIRPLAATALLFQEMGETAPVGLNLPESLQALNALRMEKQWPLVTQMSCFNPSFPPLSTFALELDLKILRADWERGLILLLKKQMPAGIEQLLPACMSLGKQSTTQALSQIAQTLHELLPLLKETELPLAVELVGRFDTLLRDADHLQIIPAENLLRDALFYLSLQKPDAFVQAWEWTEEGKKQLQERLCWQAKKFSTLLYPKEDTDKIDKALIEKNLVPLTDALLFLNDIKLRTRLILRLEKIEPRMLKIAVPIQVLMAEALRLATSPLR
jgi:hypothetical protein